MRTILGTSRNPAPHTQPYLESLTARIRACRHCVSEGAVPGLPHEPRPIFQLSGQPGVLIASQAPGIRAHVSGIPFEDPSGDRLRLWLGVTRAVFYDAAKFSIVPMGFCFPGHTPDKGDLPPRRECARLWHDALMTALPEPQLLLAIGRHAQTYHYRRLGRDIPPRATLEDLVRDWRRFAGARPVVMALPHPSWRNSGWLKRHPWFEQEVLPELRQAVATAIGTVP